jgi:hypothetical protein
MRMERVDGTTEQARRRSSSAANSALEKFSKDIRKDEGLNKGSELVGFGRGGSVEGIGGVWKRFQL